MTASVQTNTIYTASESAKRKLLYLNGGDRSRINANRDVIKLEADFCCHIKFPRFPFPGKTEHRCVGVQWCWLSDSRFNLGFNLNVVFLVVFSLTGVPPTFLCVSLSLCCQAGYSMFLFHMSLTFLGNVFYAQHKHNVPATICLCK